MNHNHKGGIYVSATDNVTAYDTEATGTTGHVSASSSKSYDRSNAYTSSTNLNHRHSLSFTPSVSGSLTSNDNETRPINFTVKVWKRIS